MQATATAIDNRFEPPALQSQEEGDWELELDYFRVVPAAKFCCFSGGYLPAKVSDPWIGYFERRHFHICCNRTGRPLIVFEVCCDSRKGMLVLHRARLLDHRALEKGQASYVLVRMIETLLAV